MAGAWERELRARRLRAAAERWDVERERAEAVERARQAAMSRREVVLPTRVVPEVRQAERRSFWDRLPTGTPMVRPVEEQPTVEEFAAQLRPAGQLVSDVLFGPEVESVRPGRQEAGLLERFARTQAGEQEFRTAAERFGEGRPGSGLAWGLLGLAGAVPFFGDIAQGAAGVSRAVRGAGAAGDVARGARNVNSALKKVDDLWHEEARLEWLPDYGRPYDEFTGEALEGEGLFIRELDELEREIPGITQFSDDWAYSSEVNLAAREALAEAARSGGKIPDTYDGSTLAIGLDAVSKSPPTRSWTYRASTFTPEEAAALRGAEDIDLPLSSFSYLDTEVMNYLGLSTGDRGVQVLFRLREGAQAVPIGAIARETAPTYGEVVTAGRFRVSSVTESVTPSGTMSGGVPAGNKPYLDVELEYVEPFEVVERGRDSFIRFPDDNIAAGDVARGAEASRITLTERAIPVEPQTGKSILDDATPGLADGDAVIRGVDEAFRARGQDSLWVPGERIDLEAPGISIGRVSNYDAPYFLNDIKSAGYRPWKEAVDIIKQLQGDVVAIDRSYYAVDNRKMWELFEEAADLNDWQPVPAPTIYDPTGSNAGSWFDSPDADAIDAFVQSLYARARSQVWANNALVQQKMLRSISEIDEAQRARDLIEIERARFSSISDLMRDANPIIQTDAYLFDSRITRDGFRNQFFTGTSRGDLDFYNRVIAESAMLGIPPHLGATHRPVYGYIGRIPERGSADIGADFTPRLINSPESIAAFARHIMSPNQAWIEQYGDIGVVFDRSKLSDSTFTLGDSLGAASQGKVVASNAGNITPNSLLTATAEPLSPSSRSNVARYFEWQYVNPSLDDIVAIYMKNDAPYRTVLNALRRAGLSDVEIIVGVK